MMSGLLQLAIDVSDGGGGGGGGGGSESRGATPI